MSYTPRLKEQYSSVIVKSLTEKFGYKSVMRVPKLQKIVGAVKLPKTFDEAQELRIYFEEKHL
jgi:ribosomal protein L5